MKIQIASQKRIANDCFTVWPEVNPEVDLKLDPRPPYGLGFHPGTLSTIYAFDVLGMTPVDCIIPMLVDFGKMLKEGGVLYIIETDFDYVNRAYLGGDLAIHELNQTFNRKTFVNRDFITEALLKAGFGEAEQRIWHAHGIKQFTLNHYELAHSATKKSI